MSILIIGIIVPTSNGQFDLGAVRSCEGGASCGEGGKERGGISSTLTCEVVMKNNPEGNYSVPRIGDSPEASKQWLEEWLTVDGAGDGDILDVGPFVLLEGSKKDSFCAPPGSDGARPEDHVINDISELKPRMDKENDKECEEECDRRGPSGCKAYATSEWNCRLYRKKVSLDVKAFGEGWHGCYARPGSCANKNGRVVNNNPCTCTETKICRGNNTVCNAGGKIPAEICTKPPIDVCKSKFKLVGTGKCLCGNNAPGSKVCTAVHEECDPSSHTCYEWIAIPAQDWETIYTFEVKMPTHRNWDSNDPHAHPADLRRPPLIVDTFLGAGTQNLAYTVREDGEAASPVFGVVKVPKPHIWQYVLQWTDETLNTEIGIYKILAQAPKVDGVMNILATVKLFYKIPPKLRNVKNNQAWVPAPVNEFSGPSLSQVVKFVYEDDPTSGHPPWPDALVYFYWDEMFVTLEQVHSRNIVVVDIDYDNTVFAGRDGQMLFKLIDMGKAFATEDTEFLIKETEAPFIHKWTGHIYPMPARWAREYDPRAIKLEYTLDANDDVSTVINVGLLLHTGFEETASPYLKEEIVGTFRGKTDKYFVCEEISFRNFDEQLRQTCRKLMDQLKRGTRNVENSKPDYKKLKNIVRTALAKKLGKSKDQVSSFDVKREEWNKFQRKIGSLEFIIP